VPGAIRPRLLLLGQTLPFPPDSGVNIRMYHTLRLLSRSFDVTALFFYRRSERRNAGEVAAALEGLRAFAEVEAFPIPQEHSFPRLLWDHLRSSVTQRAYTWYALESAPLLARVRELLSSERFDLVQIDSLDLACYLPILQDIPIVCVHHNVESALLRRRAGAEPNIYRRHYLAMQAGLLERLEREWCGKVALNVTVSEVDLAILEGFAPAAQFACVPNGVDVEAFHPEAGRDDGMVSVGGINWFPNQDALAWFAADILPRIRAAVPSAPVVWVGRSSREERAHWHATYGVELTGYVTDVRPFVRNAACFVVPLRVGGGTRLKILDAWAMGKAIVSTSVGCEGLSAVDGVNILIRDTAESFADAATQVLSDAGLRARLGRAGRETAERRYSWEVIGVGLLGRYLELATHAASRIPR
jgi:glycosyltransferase involved in cell wall biosynthesis